jgi:hypothetical protein
MDDRSYFCGACGNEFAYSLLGKKQTKGAKWHPKKPQLKFCEA